MPDDRSGGGHAPQRINLLESSEVLAWAGKFGVTIDALKEAVEAVGKEATRVESSFGVGSGSDDAEPVL